MSKRKRHRRTVPGLPPGTLVHVGEQRMDAVELTVLDYDAARVEERRGVSVADCLAYRDNASVTWINVDGLHQVEVIQKLGEAYGIHALTLEDILNTDQRPKLEAMSDAYLYSVVKMFSCSGPENDVRSEQVSMVLGPNFLISFQEEPLHDVFDPVRERIRHDQGAIRKNGPDYLAYRLFDAIVDQYFVVVERIGERIEDLESDMIEHPTPGMLSRLHALKRELIDLRKAIWPLREVVAGFHRDESPLVKPGTIIFWRDVHDHTVQVIETLESYRELLSGLHDLYLSLQSIRMNEIMKILTVITTIFIPLSFIAGVYGMNFSHMPELSWRYGYPVALGLMFGLALAMVLWFRRRRWL